jgi:Domain of unknown function (DUF397)
MSSSDMTGATWRKPTYSNAQGSCVEAGSVPGRVLVRDTTQHGNGPVVSVSPRQWHRFTASIRANAAITGVLVRPCGGPGRSAVYP